MALSGVSVWKEKNNKKRSQKRNFERGKKIKRGISIFKGDIIMKMGNAILPGSCRCLHLIKQGHGVIFRRENKKILKK